LEANLIKKFSPKYNIRLTDGKAYPLIRITIKDTYPAVLTARRPEDPTSVYFGPFPSSNTVRSVLRLLRRIFPYHSTVHHPQKICLYYHLGLCPCIPAFDTAEAQRAYKKTMHHIVDFLEGNTGKVIKELEIERNKLSKKEKFEEAGRIQKQIDNINFITHPVHKPFEYETNPNLKEDLRYKEIVSLQHILSNHGVQVALLERIECYDNSNIQGTNPTSSMVVLTNGSIDKSQYRKFKVRSVKGPNDFATMQEVLQRRFAHTEWPYPDLLIVDGGKGQISSAAAVLDELGITIPLVGLAKREETIITRDFQEITLKKSDPALQLVMRIRDEAHRFAITFHRKLRSKNMLTFEA
jgi:excinuclease ABC subunit C